MSDFSGFDVNLDDIPEPTGRDFEPIPAGTYDLQAIDAVMKNTKDNTGQYLELALEVISGPHGGRRMWDRLNLRNNNAKTQEIAWEQFKALTMQLGLKGRVSEMQPSDLTFKPFRGRVSVKVDQSGQFPPSNNVRYDVKGAGPAPAPGNGQPQQQPQQRPAPAPTQRPPGAGQRPWNNK